MRLSCFSESASAIIDKFQQSYALVDSSVTLNYITLASDQVDVSSVLQAGGFVVPRGKAFTSIRLSSFGTFCCCLMLCP